MQLRQSNNNFIYSDLGKDTTVIYNSRTGALATLKEEQSRQLDEFLTSGREIEDKDFLDKLLQCGYLLPVCVGGCPHSRITGLDRCEQRRHNLQEYIVECAKAILRGKVHS